MKLLAFLHRDWLIYGSYRVNALFTVSQIVFSCAAFFFIGKLVDPGLSPSLAPYGGYFPFVLIGLAFSRYLAMSLSSFGQSIREEQLQGTLEAMLLTPTRPALIVLGGSLLEFVWTTVEIGLYLVIGAVIFGVDLTQINLLSSGVMLVLTLLALSSLGMLSAGGILLSKGFDPIAPVLGGIMRLISGVYFPVVMLPEWLAPVAQWVPMTYGLEGFRQAVLNGKPLGELGGEITALMAFAAILWPLAIGCFLLTLRRLKQTGTLSFR